MVFEHVLSPVVPKLLKPHLCANINVFLYCLVFSITLHRAEQLRKVMRFSHGPNSGLAAAGFAKNII